MRCTVHDVTRQQKTVGLSCHPWRLKARKSAAGSPSYSHIRGRALEIKTDAAWCPMVRVNAPRTSRRQRIPKTVSKEPLYNSPKQRSGVGRAPGVLYVVPHTTNRAAAPSQRLSANSWSRKE